MFQIDSANFGDFLTGLRKEKGYTQKELASRLYISDKAVSKWERGLSMPDISLLLPLSELLGVTTTELLSGSRIDSDNTLSVEQVETLVTKTINLSEEKSKGQRKGRIVKKFIFFSSVIIVLLEILLLYSLGYSTNTLVDGLLTVELLMLMFCGWATFLAKETLPSYYDENRIATYSDSVVRMNIPGVHFNNSNFPHILSAVQLSTAAVFVLFPLLYLVINWFFPEMWSKVGIFIILASCFSFFVPIYIVGKRYE